MYHASMFLTGIQNSLNFLLDASLKAAGMTVSVYFANCGVILVLLLCGGGKGSQKHDIEKAIRFAKKWQEK